MTTSRQRQFLSPILEWKTIPKDTLIYFEESLRRRLHSAILDAFKRRVLERGLTQKELAKRIHKSPVTINRWLSTASNLTLDSISDMMVGLGMDFDEFPFTPIEKTLADDTHKQPADQSSEEDSSISMLLNSNALLLEELGRTIEQLKKDWTASEVQSSANAGAATTLAIPAPVAGTVSGVSEKLQNQAQGGPAKVYDFAQQAQKRQYGAEKVGPVLECFA